MKRILLPTDFSEAAHKAIRFAIELFGHEEATYTLFHVHDFSSLENESLEECEERLKNETSQFSSGSHDAILKIETATGSGNVVEGILNYARKHDVDMIVMGTKGRSRPKWMGSNTEEVLLNAKCPVFAIPFDCEYKVPEKVVMPVDPHAPPSMDDFQKAMIALGNAKPRIFMISVVKDDHKPIIDDDLAQLLKNDYNCEFHLVQNGDIAESILEFNDHINPDMTILFPGKRQLFKHLLQKSISKRIAHISSIPLLSVVKGDN